MLVRAEGIPGGRSADGSDDAAVRVILAPEGPEIMAAADTFTSTIGVRYIRLTNDSGQ